MLIVLSPAKTLDYESPIPSVRTSQPRFLADSELLVERMRGFSAADLARLMKVSDRIAELNVERFQRWRQPMPKNAARPAVFAFMGDVYTGLQAASLSADALDRARHQLRILSGLYGVLRPFDLMLPYRLEMGTKVDTARGANLYQFWGGRISESLNADLRAQGDDILVNLASNEYFRAVDRNVLQARVVTPVFEDEKNGVFKVIGFHAKKARGLMAAWILERGVGRVEELEGFDVAGYRFSARDSSGDTLVFRRRVAD